MVFLIRLSVVYFILFFYQNENTFLKGCGIKSRDSEAYMSFVLIADVVVVAGASAASLPHLCRRTAH